MNSLMLYDPLSNCEAVFLGYHKGSPPSWCQAPAWNIHINRQPSTFNSLSGKFSPSLPPVASPVHKIHSTIQCLYSPIHLAGPSCLVQSPYPSLSTKEIQWQPSQHARMPTTTATQCFQGQGHCSPSPSVTSPDISIVLTCQKNCRKDDSQGEISTKHPILGSSSTTPTDQGR